MFLTSWLSRLGQHSRPRIGRASGEKARRNRRGECAWQIQTLEPRTLLAASPIDLTPFTIPDAVVRDFRLSGDGKVAVYSVRDSNPNNAIIVETGIWAVDLDAVLAGTGQPRKVTNDVQGLTIDLTNDGSRLLRRNPLLPNGGFSILDIATGASFHINPSVELQLPGNPPQTRAFSFGTAFGNDFESVRLSGDGQSLYVASSQRWGYSVFVEPENYNRQAYEEFHRINNIDYVISPSINVDLHRVIFEIPVVENPLQQGAGVRVFIDPVASDPTVGLGSVEDASQIGTKLLYSATRSGGGSFFAVASAQGIGSPLSLANRASNGAVLLSPDGDQVVYTAEQSGITTIGVESASGGDGILFPFPTDLPLDFSVTPQTPGSNPLGITQSGDRVFANASFVGRSFGQYALNPQAPDDWQPIAMRVSGTGSVGADQFSNDGQRRVFQQNRVVTPESGSPFGAEGLVLQLIETTPFKLEVNSTDDTNDGIADARHTSLREAVAFADLHAGRDKITFNLPGLHEIRLIDPNSNRPTMKLREEVELDGHLGSERVLIRPEGELNDFNVPHTALDLAASNSVISGVQFDGFRTTGLLVSGSNNRLEDNVFGQSRPNQNGLTVEGDGNEVHQNRFEQNGFPNFSNSAAIVLNKGRGNVITANRIGLKADGTSAGSQGNGIRISSSFSTHYADDNFIGGINAEDANFIAFNAGSGVRIDETLFDGPIEGPTGNAILGNSIFGNGRLGIDFLPRSSSNGVVTANDASDDDTGANNRQNFPVISAVAVTDAGTQITGTFNSTPSTTFRLEFFDSSDALRSTQTLLGSETVTTNASGDATFQVSFPQTVSGGHSVTATATVDLGGGEFGDTSEVSAPFTLTSIIVNTTSNERDFNLNDGVLDVNPNQSGNQVSLRAAIEFANANPGRDTITFNIPGVTGAPVIQPTGSMLPTITEAVVIDASTQAGGRVVIDAFNINFADSDALRVSASNVLLRGFEIKNAIRDGLRATSGLTLHDVTATENGDNGVTVTDGILTIQGLSSSFSQNGKHGIEISGSGRVVIEGETELNQNGRFGIFSDANGLTTTASLHVTSNGYGGLAFFNGLNIEIVTVDASGAPLVEITDNGETNPDNSETTGLREGHGLQLQTGVLKLNNANVSNNHGDGLHVGGNIQLSGTLTTINSNLGSGINVGAAIEDTGGGIRLESATEILGNVRFGIDAVTGSLTVDQSLKVNGNGEGGIRLFGSTASEISQLDASAADFIEVRNNGTTNPDNDPNGDFFGHGIKVFGLAKLRNATVTGNHGRGVDAYAGVSLTGDQLVQISDNKSDGVLANGVNDLLTVSATMVVTAPLEVSRNRGYGIWAGRELRFEQETHITRNGDNGIRMDAVDSVQRLDASQASLLEVAFNGTRFPDQPNGERDGHGILLVNGVVLLKNADIHGNAGDGIHLGGGGVVIDGDQLSRIYQNQGHGISTGGVLETTDGGGVRIASPVEISLNRLYGIDSNGIRLKFDADTLIDSNKGGGIRFGSSEPLAELIAMQGAKFEVLNNGINEIGFTYIDQSGSGIVVRNADVKLTNAKINDNRGPGLDANRDVQLTDSEVLRNGGDEILAKTLKLDEVTINDLDDPGTIRMTGKIAGKKREATIRLPFADSFEARPAAKPLNAVGPAGISYPFGFFEFTFPEVPPGGSESLFLSAPHILPLQGFQKFGPTPDDPTPHWYDFNFDGTTGARLNGNELTLHFVDGARGDDDLTANGIIHDPGAPAFPNSPPTGQPDSATVQQDQSAAINVLTNDTDPDDDELSVTNLTQPTNGQTSVNADGTVQYTPRTGFFGNDTFSYRAFDGDLTADAVPVSVFVNAPVTAVNDEAQTTRGVGVVIEVLSNDTNPDGDSLTIDSVTQPANGTATINADGTITFSPATNFSGETSFGYTVNDGHGSIDAATVTITVIADNPVTLALTVSNANTRLQINAANNHVELVSVANNAVLLDLTADGVTQLTLNGGREDNRLTVDFTNGNPLPSDGLFFNGGRQKRRDDLVLTGGSFDSVTHTFANRNDGTVAIDGATITYTGLEPITDNLAAVNRVFEFAATNDAITLADAARANNGRLKLTSVRSSESVEFAAPAGSLTIRSGAGNDSVTVRSLDAQFVASSSATLVIEGNDGKDSLDASRVSKSVTLRGGAGRDTLRSGSAGDLLEGGDDRDSLYGNRGNDTLSGGAERDYLHGGTGNDSLSGGADNDSIRGDAGSDQLFGDAGRDTLRGDADADLVFGGADNDFISGGSGDDCLSGGDGDDRLFGDGDVDRMRGDGNNDSLRGGSGNDILSGGFGADTVKGNSGTDRVAGGNGGDPDVGDDVVRFNRANEIDEAFALDDDWNILM